MLITVDILQKFSGVYPEDDTLQKIYINSAHDEIANYLGFDPETDELWTTSDRFKAKVQQVCFEISTLMQQEESQNIGINSKSFGESGSRSFLNIVDYTQYLKKLSSYRKGDALSL